MRKGLKYSFIPVWIEYLNKLKYMQLNTDTDDNKINDIMTNINKELLEIKKLAKPIGG